MKKIITLLLILLFTTKSTFSQSPNNIEKFTVVCVNDKDSILNKIKMSTPQFYNIGKGKRIEIKVCNEDSIQIRRVRCLLYYSNSGKKECIGKIWISPLIGYETCYFCMNVDIPLTKDEWHKLTFRIKRGKNYKDYKFLKQQVQEEKYLIRKEILTRRKTGRIVFILSFSFKINQDLFYTILIILIFVF